MANGNIGKQLIAQGRQLGPTAGGALRRVLDVAIDGVGALPGARQAARVAMQKHGSQDVAIDALVVQHIGLAGAQGFATNLGGLATLAVAIPANLGGIAVIQTRMVASVAHLRGYDLDDNRVRSAILMCLLGRTLTEELVRRGDLPSTPLGVATAPVFDPKLDIEIAERVLATMLAQVGGKKLPLLISKRIPIIGGGVGALTDGWSTRSIARYAGEQFVVRRR